MRKELLVQILESCGIDTSGGIKVNPLSGGSINEVFKVVTEDTVVCIKLNSASRFPDMFDKEANGLIAMDVEGGPMVPRPIATGNIEDDAYLVMEYIPGGRQRVSFWDEFGNTLASLHKHTADSFGWEEDNYIGSLHQLNDERKSWPVFFGECRIMPQVKMAVDGRQLGMKQANELESLTIRLGDLLPDEPPALIHGDLWSGNFMVADGGQPCIFDPAIYFGSREMDIAMSKLFGGFNSEFYDAYNHHFPMEKGWEDRIDLHNLYPLLVHVNLFGGGYVGQVNSIVNRYT